MTRHNHKASSHYQRPKSSTPRKSLSFKQINNNNNNGKIKQKKKRSRVLREIRFYQKSTGLLINKLPFLRLVKSILDEIKPSKYGFRWQHNAILALQEVAESYLTTFFEEANFVAINAKRVTIKVQDFQVVRRIRGHTDIANQ